MFLPPGPLFGKPHYWGRRGARAGAQKLAPLLVLTRNCTRPGFRSLEEL